MMQSCLWGENNPVEFLVEYFIWEVKKAPNRFLFEQKTGAFLIDCKYSTKLNARCQITSDWSNMITGITHRSRDAVRSAKRRGARRFTVFILAKLSKKMERVSKFGLRGISAIGRPM